MFPILDSTLQYLPATRQAIPGQGKRKAPMERKPLGNISNYKQHCRSVGNPIQKEKVINKAKQINHTKSQEAIPVTLTEETVLAAGGQNQMNPIETNIEREETVV